MKTHRSDARLRATLMASVSAALLLAGCASTVPAPVDARSAQPTLAASPAPVVASEVRDTYTVKPGDTLYSIAREHGMDFRELIALNAIDSPGRITPGRVLKVKPQGVAASPSSAVASTTPIQSETVLARPLGSNSEGLKREPKGGKLAYSEQALAAAQGRPAEAAAAVAKPEVMPEVKPEAKPEAKPEVKAEAKPADAAPNGDEVAWIWPATGKLIGTFSEGGSKGVDIAGKLGDPVVAAADGRIVYSGTGLRGYGKLVIIKHNKAYLSVYAHNSQLLVKEGQNVVKGQRIAEMGNTDSAQIKLHFEIRRFGKPVDPIKLLPPEPPA